MGIWIEPLSQDQNVSIFTLRAEDFDVANTGYTQLDGAGAVVNDNFNADTPKGVLGGQVVTWSTNPTAAEQDNEVERADGDGAGADGIDSEAEIAAAIPIGIFANDSEGNAFENSPAAASGIVPVYIGTGVFLVYSFETHAREDAAALTYAVGDKLYASVNGANLTKEVPSATSASGNTTTDHVVGYCTKAPTSSDLELGMILQINPA